MAEGRKRMSKPGASMIRTALDILSENGFVVLPDDWDPEYTLTELNVWLWATLRKGHLVVQPSLGLEGAIGARVTSIAIENRVAAEKEKVG